MNLDIKKNRQLKISLTLQSYIVLFTLFNLVLYTGPFLNYINTKTESTFFISSLFVLFFILLNMIFSILFTKKTTKVLSTLILIINAASLYYMNLYKIQIDVYMLINVFETNLKEASDIIGVGLIKSILLLGLLPSVIFIYFITIEEDSFRAKKRIKFWLCQLSFLAVFSIFSYNYKKEYGFLLSIRRRVFNYTIPINYMGNLGRLVYIKTKGLILSRNIIDISSGSKLNKKFTSDRKNLIILVVGESARSQNFSLNGYERNTNEPLKDYNILSFKNVSSCGTATAHSIPCIFSHLDRKRFTILEGKKYENLLDIFNKLNFDVRWRSNNGDCKGVCNRVSYLSTDGLDINGHDQSIIRNLHSEIKKLSKKNTIIVINQRGSHDPYNKRYPKEFEIYKPACDTDIGGCSIEELINVYDNSIYYSSYNLKQILDILSKDLKDYNTMLLYVSDHGDGFGENGVWTHGMPYSEATDYVKKVPFLLWLSDNFVDEFKVDKKCLTNKINDNLSHDNIFHSMLGLFDIENKYYDENLDIFRKCKLQHVIK